MLIRLFQQATSGSVDECLARRFRRRYASFSRSLPVMRLARLTWRPAAGRTASCAPGAEIGAFYVMDRAYLDFERLHSFHRNGAFFVTRTKTGVVLNRRYSHAVPPDTGVSSDQTVVLGTAGSARNYPDMLRRVRFVDPETNRRFIFLTNNFELPAFTIAQLYKSRWRIELFFKWIKQHLRIKAFYGYSENAVKTQIWIAVASYVLIAILKKRLLLDASLHEILQVLSLNLFEKTPILRACGEARSQEKSDGC